MQETHLKKVEKTEILATLKSFNVGDSERIPFSESRVDTDTWRARCGELKRKGHLSGRYKFIRHDIENSKGTLIMRVA